MRGKEKVFKKKILVSQKSGKHLKVERGDARSSKEL